MNFKKVFKILIKEFNENKIDFALIGGHALNIHNVTRTTIDIDFVLLLENSEEIDMLMKKNGYECLHRTDDVANYLSKNSEMGQVDFLFAHRKYSLSMLDRAEYKDVFENKIKVLLPEDLIGLKVQSSSNDKLRYFQDMSDIQELIKANDTKLDLQLVREYFKLFNREEELDNIIKEMQI